MEDRTEVDRGVRAGARVGSPLRADQLMQFPCVVTVQWNQLAETQKRDADGD
jgi:hypothetical protein